MPPPSKPPAPSPPPPLPPGFAPVFVDLNAVFDDNNLDPNNETAVEEFLSDFQQKAALSMNQDPSKVRPR